jgi:branched-chain amino acid transport system permease protein
VGELKRSFKLLDSTPVTMLAMNTLIYTVILALISVGLNMILGILRILNVAHGVFMAVGAYLSITLVRFFLSSRLPVATTYLALILAGLIAGVLIGFIIEPAILRRIYSRIEVHQLLVTFALMLIIEDLIKFIWGPQSQIVTEPYLYLGVLNIGGLSYPLYYLFLLAVGYLILLLTYLILNHTKLGKIFLATAYDREISVALGIDVKKVYTYAFTLGATLTTLGGALMSPTLSLQPGFSTDYIVLAFAVVVVGGLGDVKGAFIASLLMAFARALIVIVIPELELATVFIIMLFTILLRPEGILKGRKT